MEYSALEHKIYKIKINRTAHTEKCISRGRNTGTPIPNIDTIVHGVDVPFPRSSSNLQFRLCVCYVCCVCVCKCATSLASDKILLSIHTVDVGPWMGVVVPLPSHINAMYDLYRSTLYIRFVHIDT